MAEIVVEFNRRTGEAIVTEVGENGATQVRLEAEQRHWSDRDWEVVTLSGATEDAKKTHGRYFAGEVSYEKARTA